ncbi:MAG: DNA polymerase III subunit gamma/tau, partial [Beijerinckiaceae bacterium]
THNTVPQSRPVLAATGSDGGGRMQMRAQPHAAPGLAAAPALAQPQTLQDIIALADKHRDVQLKASVQNDIHLVRFEQGRIVCRIGPGASRTLPNDLSRALQAWTGERWIVALSQDEGAPTLRQQKDAAVQDTRRDAENHPLVRAILDAVPGAKVAAVTDAADMPLPDAVITAPPVFNEETGDLEFAPLDDYTDDDL